MTADVLLTQCRTLGVILAPGPCGKLLVSPPGKLPVELREALQQHKTELLELLKSRQGQDPRLASNYRQRYCEMAESIADDCQAIAPVWWLEHPEQWEQIRNLDERWTKLEQGDEQEHEITRTLEQIARCVRDARTCYEREQQASEEERQ